jgi:hypothetical protein
MTMVYQGHEEAGAKIAEQFLLKYNLADEVIEQVKTCITATQYPTSPTNLLEEVVCDADLCYIGKPNSMSRANLLRQEWKMLLKKKLTEAEWLNSNIGFIASHNFYTSFALDTYEPEKRKLLEGLRQELEIVQAKE